MDGQQVRIYRRNSAHPIEFEYWSLLFSARMHVCLYGATPTSKKNNHIVCSQQRVRVRELWLGQLVCTQERSGVYGEGRLDNDSVALPHDVSSTSSLLAEEKRWQCLKCTVYNSLSSRYCHVCHAVPPPGIARTHSRATSRRKPDRSDVSPQPLHDSLFVPPEDSSFFRSRTWPESENVEQVGRQPAWVKECLKHDCFKRRFKLGLIVGKSGTGVELCATRFLT